MMNMSKNIKVQNEPKCCKCFWGGEQEELIEHQP